MIIHSNIYRNQAWRTAFKLWQHKDKDIVYYFMPEGRMFINILNWVGNTGTNYKAISLSVCMELIRSEENKQSFISMLKHWQDELDSLLDETDRYSWKHKRLNEMKESINKQIEFIR